MLHSVQFIWELLLVFVCYCLSHNGRLPARSQSG